MAKKLFNNASIELTDLQGVEDQEEKEEKEKEKEKENEKSGYYDCFFEYDIDPSGTTTGSFYFRDGSNMFPVSDYRTEVFSPPEAAAV